MAPASRLSRRRLLGSALALVSSVALSGCKRALSTKAGPSSEGPSTSSSETRPKDTAPLTGRDGPMKGTHALAVSADGTLLASGDGDGTIRLWSLPKGERMHSWSAGKGPVGRLAFTPDGKTLIGLVGPSVGFWSVPAGKHNPPNIVHGGPVKSMALSADGKVLATGGVDGSMKTWQLPENKPLQTLQLYSAVSALALSKDAKQVAAAYGFLKGAINIITLPDLKRLEKPIQLERGIGALAIAPDGELLVSGSGDGKVRLWSLAQGKLLKELPGYGGAINDLALCADGKLLAAGADDPIVRIWSLPDGMARKELKGHKAKVRSVAIAPDGKTVLSGDEAGVLLLNDLEGGTQRALGP